MSKGKKPGAKDKFHDECDTPQEPINPGEGAYRGALKEANDMGKALFLALVFLLLVLLIPLLTGGFLALEHALALLYAAFMVCFAAALYYFGSLQKLKHARAARRLGLEYYPTSFFTLMKSYDHLNMVALGKKDLAYAPRHTFAGKYKGHDIILFNLGSLFAGGIITLAGDFPELRVWHGKLPGTGMARRMDLPEIDLDNLEFSQAFKVKCKSRKFCYHVLSPRLMEFLLTMGKVRLEVEHNTLFLSFPGLIVPGKLEEQLDQMVAMKEHLPAYLFRKKKKKKKRREEDEREHLESIEETCARCSEPYEYIEEYGDYYCWECREYLSEWAETEGEKK